MLVKEPGTAARTPWHHDQSYYPVDGDDLCSLWIPVDPVRCKVIEQISNDQQLCLKSLLSFFCCSESRVFPV